MEDGRVETYRVLSSGATAQIIEKKSKFIATIRPVETEEEAANFIDEIKKKYYNARHNCFAFIVGSKKECVRFSDDGEPGGTAGRPMLEVLLGWDLCNAAVVVTRYFGGVLLGTGGLVRAYTTVVQEALAQCDTNVMTDGIRIEITMDYNGIGKIQYLLGKRGLTAENIAYADKVIMEVIVPAVQLENISKEIIETTAGQAFIEEKDRLYFVDKEDKH